MRMIPVAYDHPDAVKLADQAQELYAGLYGGGDATPLDPAQFRPPRGLYLIVYDAGGEAVACGGWRAMDRNGGGYADGDAELKRMYVVPRMRGRGLARRVLAALEDDARRAGRRRMVLETGSRQPEAISLYLSSGYAPAAAKFGLYRDHEGSRCFTKPFGP
ncbi:GNAT family N-acetyltransferase [Streptomyces mashuensis]|nr:GNAT family N-acetyltransferase [Streptomyces mashuensis]